MATKLLEVVALGSQRGHLLEESGPLSDQISIHDIADIADCQCCLPQKIESYKSIGDMFMASP